LAASADGITVRNDTGVSEGSEISVYYDPLIAKLITHAGTRDAATAAQADALDAFTIDGIRHNVPFLAAVMQHKRWRAGKLSTAFIAEEYPQGFRPVAPEGETLHVMAAVAAAIDHVLGERKRRISGQRPGQTVVRESARVVRLGEREVELSIAREGPVHVPQNMISHPEARPRPLEPGEPRRATAKECDSGADHPSRPAHDSASRPPSRVMRGRLRRNLALSIGSGVSGGERFDVDGIS
jgi:propionyl-CoA carboxylase alpha chain